MSRGVLIEGILPYLDAKLIRKYYDAAPGREFESGKFTNRESSAALAANAFGFFCPSDRASLLPRLPGAKGIDWPANDIKLESCQRFPWRGGRHPYLDVVVKTPTHLIGIESKRFEPFRDKPAVSLSKAYWRKEWGTRMRKYEQVRDRLNASSLRYSHLDACQLVKHALGLRTQAVKQGRRPILFYLYAEPPKWASGEAVSRASFRTHRAEILDFAKCVRGDEVAFLSCDYGTLLKQWSKTGGELAKHAASVISTFTPMTEGSAS